MFGQVKKSSSSRVIQCKQQIAMHQRVLQLEKTHMTNSIHIPKHSESMVCVTYILPP